MSKTINLNIPSSWLDLKDRQLEKIALIFNTEKPSHLYDLKILSALLDFKWYQLKKVKAFTLLLSYYRLSDIKKAYSWIYKDADLKHFISKVTIGKKTYYAPANFLFNVTIEEFSIVDDLYFKYRSAKSAPEKREILEYIAAVLYTPTKVRPEFTVETLETLRAPFKKTKLSFLFAALLSYSGNRFSLEKRYKRVFGGVQRKDVKKKYGFGKVILEMAGKKFGTHQETKRTRIHTFLEQLEEDLTPKNNNKPKK